MFLKTISTASALFNRRLLSTISSYPKFSSNQSVDKLYANNSKPEKLNEVSFEGDKFTGFIPIKKLEIAHTTSSGPGGQNVNRMFTKVIIKFNVDEADWIPEVVRIRIKDVHKNSINKNGEWMIKSDKTRYQHMNLADCLDKLRCYLTEAAKPLHVEPSFETLEKMKQNQEKAAIKRLEEKRRRSLYKAQKRWDW